MESPLAVFLTFVITVVGGAFSVGLYEFYRKRTRVRRITNPDDKDLLDFFDLYERLIPEDERETPEEIRGYLKAYQQSRLDKITQWCEEILIIAKTQGTVSGFLYANYYPSCRYGFVAYFGIDRKIENARKFSSSTLLKKLNEVFRREFGDCKAILFEVDSPEHAGNSRETRKRRARKALFKEYAARSNLTVCEFPFIYVHPAGSLDGDVEHAEQKMNLMYVPINISLINGIMPKHEVIEVLRFLYLEFWMDRVSVLPVTEQERYKSYLTSFVERYIRALPEQVIMSC